MRRKKRLLAALLGLPVATLLVLGVWLYEPDPGDRVPRVLVSVDRTLWNRIGLNRFTYVRALRRAGLRPMLVDFASIEPAAPAAEWLEGMDGLVLSGGGDVAASLYGGDESVNRDVNRDRDTFELALLAEAESRSLPVLGLCRGAQLLNVYRGGTLADFREDTARYRRHKRIRPGHPVTLDPDSRLARILGTTELEKVVTYHGQYVKEAGESVHIVAHARDGTPEAIEIGESDAFGMLGVQWHAEVPPSDAHQQRLFDAFGEAVAGRERPAIEPSARREPAL